MRICSNDCWKRNFAFFERDNRLNHGVPFYFYVSTFFCVSVASHFLYSYYKWSSLWRVFPTQFHIPSRFEFVCEIWKIQSLSIFQNGPSNCFLSAFYRRERLWISGDSGETQNNRTGTDHQLDRDSFFGLPAASLGGLQCQSSRWPWRGGGRDDEVVEGLVVWRAARHSLGVPLDGGVVSVVSGMRMRLNARFNSSRVPSPGFCFFNLLFFKFSMSILSSIIIHTSPHFHHYIR